jgi:serine/threonine protein phosphatase PrpC
MDGSPALKAFRFRSVSQSHCGHVRPLNEDRVLDRPEAGFWAVADGMGGHHGGDVAATRLVEALDRIDHRSPGYTRLNDVRREIETVNTTLFDAEGGTTLVALLVHEGHYACLWAGDSRVYLLRNGRLDAITRDHSVVQALVDGGVITEAERKRHPRAHVVTRAVGANSVLDIEQSFAPICDGDVFLLCSDGLTACLEDAEIENILNAENIDLAAPTMLTAALDRQAPDNISFVLVHAKQI